MKEYRYFPNIAEINKYLKKEQLPSWNNKVIEIEKVSEEEQKELEEMMKKYKED